MRLFKLFWFPVRFPFDEKGTEFGWLLALECPFFSFGMM
jgi:hypothetical protein